MQKRLNSEAETIDFAEQFATTLHPGDVVALSGELGAGKSVLARAIMRGLGVMDAALPSPTFTIVQEYEGRGCRVAHMDWYRLSGEDELEAIGIREYFHPPWICLIEWPGRAPALLQGKVLRIHMQCVANEPEVRLIEVT